MPNLAMCLDVGMPVLLKSRSRGEEMGGVERVKNVIRIYCMRKNAFSDQ